MDPLLILKEMEKEDGKRVFLLFGEETYLQKEMIQVTQSRLLKEETRDFNEAILDGRKVSLSDVLNTARTTPVLDQARLTVAEEVPYFKDAADQSKQKKGKKDPQTALLENFLREDISYSCLVFTAKEVDQRRGLYRLIARHGAALECKPLKGRELSTWIDRKVKALGKKMRRDAVEVFVDTVGSDLRLIRQELLKLSAFVGEDKDIIDRDDVKTICSKTLESNIFSLVDSVGRKDRREALNKLSDMLLINEPPVRILYMLIRQMRLIYDSHVLKEEGISSQKIPAALKTHPYGIQKALEHSSYFTDREMKKNLQVLLTADEELKTGQGQPKLILETVILKMSTH